MWPTIRAKANVCVDGIHHEPSCFVSDLDHTISNAQLQFHRAEPLLLISMAMTAWHAILLAGVAFLSIRLYQNRRRRRNCPPGPNGLPIIGNVLDIPLEHASTAYRSMAEKHGTRHPIRSFYLPPYQTPWSNIGTLIYLEALGQPLLVLNSFKRANDLLDKRSFNYSSRPCESPLKTHLDT